ncbi:hypothetical protein GCM10023264_20210 [Sphingomonas daechungensis]
MFTNSLAIGLVLLAQGSPAMQMPVAVQVTTLPAPIPPTTRPPVTRPPTVRPPMRPDHRVPYFSRSNYIDGRGFAGRVRCNSQNGRFNSCSARTQNRVMLIRTHGGNCRRGHSWGYDSRRVWVSQSCRATFAYGYGHYYPDRENNSSSGGSNTALIIGGIAVAAGLAAILSNSGKNIDTSSSSAGPPAAISADPNWVQQAARPALNQCLTRAARDVGATGGTRITLQTAAASEIEPGAFQIGGTLTAQYPDSTRELPMLCEATADGVDQFEFKS